MTWLLPLLALAGPAEARKPKAPEGCERIKPAQQLEAENQVAVDALVQARIAGMGGGSADIEAETKTRYAVQLLGEDALAQSWYTYQLCVLKEVGAITPVMHEALMRKLWGLEPAAPAVVSPAVVTPAVVTPAVVQPAPVAVAQPAPVQPAPAPPAGPAQAHAPAPGKAAVVLTCAKTNILAKGTFPTKIGDSGVQLTSAGTALVRDVDPGRVALSVGLPASRLDFVAQVGQVHYVLKDISIGGLSARINLQLIDAELAQDRMGSCRRVKRVD
jgi:hypothetical protein